MSSPGDGKSPRENTGQFHFYDDAGFSQSQSQSQNVPLPQPVPRMNGFSYEPFGNNQSQSQRGVDFTQTDFTQAGADFTQGGLTQDGETGAGLEFCSQPDNDVRRRRHSSTSSSTVS